MGIIDWIILGVLLIFLVQGFRKGLAATLVKIGGAIAAFLLVGQIYPLVRNSLVLNYKLHGYVATLVAFVLVGILILVIVRLLIFLLNQMLKAAHLSFLNKFMGMLFGFAYGLLIIFVVMAILDYAPKLSTPLKDASKHRVYAAADTLKEDLFTQLKLTQRDKYHQILDKLKKDKTADKPSS